MNGALSGASTLLQQVNNNTLPAALQGKQLSVDGQTLVTFQFGQLLNGGFMIGGDPSVDEIYGLGNLPLVTPTTHASVFTHADYDFTDHLKGFAEVSFNHVLGGPIRASYPSYVPTTASAASVLKLIGGPNDQGNPFISQAVRNAVLAADPGITGLLVATVTAEAGDQSQSHSRNDTTRLAFGLDGDVISDWKWNASYTYGETDG